MTTKTLTEKDLMIGDYMMYKDGTIVQIARVGDISPMDSHVYCHTQLNGYFPCRLADLEPIPLTVEFLQKNGFIKTAWDVFLLRNSEFGVERIERGFFARIPGARICKIGSVSHLQHLLRDFGIDKAFVARTGSETPDDPDDPNNPADDPNSGND